MPTPRKAKWTFSIQSDATGMETFSTVDFPSDTEAVDALARFALASARVGYFPLLRLLAVPPSAEPEKK